MPQMNLNIAPSANPVNLDRGFGNGGSARSSRAISSDAARVLPLRPQAVAAPTTGQSVDWEAVLTNIVRGRTVLEYGVNRSIYQQGQPADHLFYLRRGKVKLTVISPDGKEAIVAVLDAGEFFGEGCLAGQTLRMATAVAITDCTVDKLEKSLMVRMLHEQHEVTELLVKQLLTRSLRYESDLVDQFFNSSEKRLARILLRLAHFGRDSKAKRIFPSVSQATLAQMVGTTRSRVSQFMNKFRSLGFIEYDDTGLTIHRGLLNLVPDRHLVG